jgi:hypothetical protein
LVVTPLVNTQIDQIILVTVLLAAFGMAVESRLGTWRALAIFWGTSGVAAIAGGVLLHVLYPMFPDVHTFGQGGWERVFNGGSAGGFGLLGAFAATSRRPMLWIGLFLVWEPLFWFFVSHDYTSAFHFIAVATGYAAGRYLRAGAEVRNSKRSPTSGLGSSG